MSTYLLKSPTMESGKGTNNANYRLVMFTFLALLP